MASKGETDKSKIMMASIAGVIILGVGAWLAKYYGLIGGGDEVPAPVDIRQNMTAEDQKEFDKMQADKQELMKRTPPSGS